MLSWRGGLPSATPKERPAPFWSNGNLQFYAYVGGGCLTEGPTQLLTSIVARAHKTFAMACAAAVELLAATCRGQPRIQAQKQNMYPLSLIDDAFQLGQQQCAQHSFSPDLQALLSGVVKVTEPPLVKKGALFRKGVDELLHRVLGEPGNGWDWSKLPSPEASRSALEAWGGKLQPLPLRAFPAQGAMAC